MALSVSGFPEPSRQVAPANEVFTGETAPDGTNKTTLMNSPRLRGLFGASGVPNKKADARIYSTTSKAEETEGGTIPTTPPIAAASIAFVSAYEPLPQEEYELELQLPMASSSNPPADSNRGAKRPQLPPVPRRTATSPVRLGPSLTRLDIGAFSRPPATHHAHPKPQLPSVVVEDWAPKQPDATARPLPNVPSATADTGKKLAEEPSGSDFTAPVAGPSRHVNAVAGSSKHVNAVAGSSKHVNAVAGPSRQANAMAGPSTHPGALNIAASAPSTPSSSTISSSPPASKVIMHQPSQRGHKGNSQSLSMRYQPLVADPTAAAAPEPSTEPSLTSPVRPLPRIPPPAPAPSTSVPPSPKAPSVHPVNIKRPKPSTAVVPSFPVGSAPNSISRSPFDNATTWRSKPVVTTNPALRASSPPLPISSPHASQRSRSASRPRRDRSLDPYYPLNKPALKHAVPPITTNVTGGRNPRTLPSPVIPGARPLIKSHTLEHMTPKPKPFPIQTGRGETGGSTGRVLSPGGGRRSQPPTPPAGPVRQRPKAVSLSSSVPPVISVVIPVQPQPLPPARAAIDVNLSKMESGIDGDKKEGGDAPLHSHPTDEFADNDSLLHPPMSPSTEDSPIEVYIDDQDMSTLSRSPSPIRYARPDSRGELSDTDGLEELDFASSSSTASSPSSSPTRRRRVQLRSYRMSYRPHAERTSPPAIPYRDPAPKAAPPAEKTKEQKKKEKEKKKKKYFEFPDFGGGGTSAPTTRASSPERKSRSRQPRKLADAVSLALERGNKPPAPSASPKRKGQQNTAAPPVATGPIGFAEVVTEVLDISRPRTSRRNTATTTDTTASSSISDHMPTASSTRSSAKSWGKLPVTGGTNSNRNTASSGGVHNGGMPTFTKDEFVDEYPPNPAARRAKTPRRTVSPAPPLPTPHQSFRAGEHSRPRTTSANGGNKARPGPGAPEFNIVTTVSAAGASRPPSSAASSPFSAFSMSNRSSTKSKAKHSSTPSVTLPVDETVLVIQPKAGVVGAGTPSTATLKPEEEQEEEDDGTGEVQARMIMRTVDSGGDIWEHERKEEVADVIPHLRQLKAKR